MRFCHRFDRLFAYKAKEGRYVRIKYIYYRFHELNLFLEIYHKTVLMFNNNNNNNINDNNNNNNNNENNKIIIIIIIIIIIMKEDWMIAAQLM
jgi:hypothetical protein